MRLPFRFFRDACMLALALVLLSGCDSYLDQEPQNILTDEEVYSSPALVRSVMANYYSRLDAPFYKNLTGAPDDWTYIDEALWSGIEGNYQNGLGQYPYGTWALYEGGSGYGLIGDLNQTLETLQDTTGPATQLNDEVRTRFVAETRFMRAFVHLELVKRMGGVPIITRQYVYDGPDSVPGFRRPRNTEKEVYDFVAEELDAVMDDLPLPDVDKSRANHWTAQALKARAMLYGASIARYNGAKTPSVEVSGAPNLVGMSDADPDVYYERALAAAEDVIQNSPYQLYSQNDDLQENFYDAIVSKASNPEVMWVTDYDGSGDRAYGHLFNYWVMPRSARDDNLQSAAVSPSLDLVEAFDYQDGTDGEIQTCQDASIEGNCIENGSDFIYFEDKAAPFQNKDPRLWGSIMYPGSTYRGAPLDFLTGVAVWNDTTETYSLVSGALSEVIEEEFAQNVLAPNIGAAQAQAYVGQQLTGLDGPLNFEPHTSNTGFYLRKFVSESPGAGSRGTRSNVWWVRIRYGEVLLIAAEAALELGQESKALGYVNQLRERAGMPAYSALTMEDIKQERRVELAFEEHRLWDLRRWRDAHEVWDGTVDSDPATIDGAYVYRVVRPGDERDGSYIYVKRRAPRHTLPRFFRLGNYYSAFPANALNSNPELVRNPFH